jgi:hypothetical protein
MCLCLSDVTVHVNYKENDVRNWQRQTGEATQPLQGPCATFQFFRPRAYWGLIHYQYGSPRFSNTRGV